MASNLKSARQAIEAELAHAKQGAAYYATRVEALETALQQLDSVEAGTASSTRTASAQTGAGSLKKNGARTRRRIRAASTNGNGASLAAPKRSRKARSTTGTSRSDDSLFTGGDFWLSLVSEQPRSAVDIANAAIETLGISPDQKDKIQKLKQRVSPALAGLVSSHKINDSGSGRERRFFKSGQAGAH